MLNDQFFFVSRLQVPCIMGGGLKPMRGLQFVDLSVCQLVRLLYRAFS